MTRRTALLLPLAFAAGLAAGLLAARRAPEPAPPAGPRPAHRPPATPEESPASAAPDGEAVPGRSVVLPVVVRRPDGSAPTEAELSCRLRSSDEAPLLRTWRPDAPRIELPAGSFDIRAVAGADREFASETARVLLRAGEVPPPLTLTLAALGGVRGRVVLPSSLSLRSVVVGAWSVGESPRRLGACEARGADGFRYAICGLPPGPCRLVMPDLDFVAREVTLSEGMVETDLIVPDPAEGAIVVRVHGPDGAPVFSFWVEVCSPADPYGWEERNGCQDIHAGAGVHFLRVGGGCDADAFLKVCVGDLGVRKVPLPPGGGAVTVRFAEPAWLSVRVKGLPESDVAEEFRVGLASTPESGAEELRSEDVEGPDGAVLFGPLQPGPVRVDLLRGEEWSETFELGSWALTLAPGRNALEVAAPALSVLRVRAPGDSGPALTLWREADGVEVGDPDWEKTEEPGLLYQFRGLPAGRYVLTLAAGLPEDGRMVVDLPVPGVVEFAAERCDALRVAKIEVDGALHRAGLAAGDLVLAVDGEEVSGFAQGRALLGLAATKESVELRVLRGATRLALKVPGLPLADGDAATFEPAAR